MFIGLLVKYPLFFSDFNYFQFPQQISEKKPSDIKFNENRSYGSRVVQCERIENRQKTLQTAMTKLTVTFRSFPNKLKNVCSKEIKGTRGLITQTTDV